MPGRYLYTCRSAFDRFIVQDNLYLENRIIDKANPTVSIISVLVPDPGTCVRLSLTTEPVYQKTYLYCYLLCLYLIEILVVRLTVSGLDLLLSFPCDYIRSIVVAVRLFSTHCRSCTITFDPQSLQYVHIRSKTIFFDSKKPYLGRSRSNSYIYARSKSQAVRETVTKTQLNPKTLGGPGVHIAGSQVVFCPGTFGQLCNCLPFVQRGTCFLDSLSISVLP